MKIWEVTSISDPITLLADDFDLACAACILIGNGQYFLQEYDVAEGERKEMPAFMFCRDGADVTAARWLRDAFPEKHLPIGIEAIQAFFNSLDQLRLAEILRSVQVCDAKDRLSYQKALEAIDDGTRKQAYAQWWKEQRRSSLNDITGRAWAIADRLEQAFRNPKQESDGTNNVV